MDTDKPSKVNENGFAAVLDDTPSTPTGVGMAWEAVVLTTNGPEGEVDPAVGGTLVRNGDPLAIATLDSEAGTTWEALSLSSDTS